MASLFSGDSVDGVFSDGLTSFLLNNNFFDIDYFLEVRERGKAKMVIPFPEQPQSVEINMDYYENPIYTFAKHFTFREIAAPRSGRVVIRGEISNRSRLALRLEGDSLNLIAMNGEDVLLNFKSFLDFYFDRATQIGSPTNFSLLAVNDSVDYYTHPHLVFRALNENIHYRASVEGFRFNKTIQKKRLAGYEWELTLRLYDRILPTDKGVIAELFGSINDAFNLVNTYPMFAAQAINTLTDQVDIGLSGIANGISNLGTSISSVSSAASNASKLGIRAMDKMGAALNALYSSITTIPDKFDGLGNKYSKSWDRFKTRAMLGEVLDKSPKKSTAQNASANTDATDMVEMDQSSNALIIAYQLEEYLSNIEKVLAFYGAYNTTNSANADTYTARGFLNNPSSFETLAGFYSGQEAALSTGNEEQTQGEYTYYIMRSGESLLTVANAILGDPLQWVILARFNNCIDAYTFADGRPIISGTRIKVPTDGGVQLHQLGTARMNDNFTNDNLYGIDLALHGNDLSFDADNSQANLQQGLPNMHQAVVMLLRAGTQQITLHPEYGTILNGLVGMKFTDRAAILVATQLREALLQDARIADVLDIQVSRKTGSDMLDISLRILTVLNDNISVRTEV